MIIEKLTMFNFGPFFGEHSLELSVSSSAPVILVYGENMRGKTSLQNAIRWCMYGYALGRGGVKKPTYRLISYDALDVQQFVTRVIIDFEHDRHKFKLERSVQASVLPLSDDDLTERVSLTKNGSFLPEREIPMVIKGILHEEIARFFLFDGEMLAQYEQLMWDSGRSNQIIRNSIEQILGLPSLRLAAQDANELRRTAEREQARAVRGVDKATQLSAQADQLQTEVDLMRNDLLALEQLLNQHTQARDQAAERRERYDEIQGDLADADRLELLIASAGQTQKEIRSAIRELLGRGWWEPVAEIAAAKAETIENSARKALAIAKSKESKELLLSQLHGLVNEGLCPVCQQSAENHQDYHAHIEELKEELHRLGLEGDDYGVDLTNAQQLRAFVSTAVTTLIASKEEDYRKTALQIRRDSQSLTQIKERIRENDRFEIRKVQKEYDAAVIALNDVETSIRQQQVKRQDKLDSLRRTNAEIAKLPEANRRINTEWQMYQGLVAALEEAVVSFAHELRSEVEQVATEIFLSLTSEEHYSRLVINDQYGLSIRDQRDWEISERSAGAEQVVALSLVGALNRSAVREGPVVMDTPFGRLDVSHRANILKFLPTMGPQVMLLVQSGEIDEQRDLVHLEGTISRQYRLVRDGSATRSRIDKAGI